MELSHLMRLDAEPEVCGLVSQPFRLSWRCGGRRRRVSHTPDYLVRRRDGRAVVLDVRPAVRVPVPRRRRGPDRRAAARSRTAGAIRG
ncbi:hypothetical protein QQY66_21945 [Streptomyces sp. DG2A-72]|uniref:hypothetical protein n=1 Tax=Streptomyces sp. DG2A-72 TaxID=3051386 RepID=UPI00265BA4C4|nr:hypothetical protein [Streptomyces sp. DG2A-72]MDO0934221.1 hypothetical protein [Streptomyces sp. DG2A-72]